MAQRLHQTWAKATTWTPTATSMMLAGESMNEMVKVITGHQKDHPDVLLIVTADHETGGMTVENLLDDDEPEPQ